ncbi:MAG TPA: cation:proton antiporter [Candidatus Acidoferrum sp.]|jgi:Kef-type K+ transport system membrane component KefB|nr:cation:proton antiporter [Candidatus Acidoferrum sp.]
MQLIDSGNMYMVAAVWMLLAALSAGLAIRFKMAAALVEILIGILAGNFIGLHTNGWIDFLAGFGSILLTYLAGAEIDPAVLREQIVPATVLGAASFGAPFVAAGLYAYFFAHWSLDGSKIAGIAMSTTSVAVVYAVMVESGLAGRKFGQLILAACFFTDLGTVVALGLLFANYNLWLVLLVVSIVLGMIVVPKFLPVVFERTRGYVSEPGLRILFAIIFLLSAIATYAKSEGVLPAYFLGLACAGMMIAHPDVKRRLQTMAMTLLTPFYFLKAGTYVSLRDAWQESGLIAAFFGVKVIAKIVGVLPLARAFKFKQRDANYLTLMMATGLTFGTISSLYGLTHHYIDQAQYTALVTVVILTALVPTIIAQALFKPTEDPQQMESEVP